MNKDSKKSIILSAIAGLTLIVLVIGTTYAYFQMQGNTSADADVRVTTYTTDVLTFETGDDINISANQTNFASGLSSLSGSTFAKAHLLANNKTNTATANYYVYLYIPDNNFIYTQEDSTPELLLQITDPNGVTVTSLDGLEYKSVTDGNGNEIKGFDITTKLGMFTIINNQKLDANPEIVESWNVSVVFVNLDADQNDNMGKTFKSQLIISKDNFEDYTPAMVNTVHTQIDDSDLTVTVNADAGTDGISKYYFGIRENNSIAMDTSKGVKLSNKLAVNTLEYVESTSNSYTFTGINSGSNYEVFAYVIDNKDITSNVYSTKINNKELVLPKISKVEVTDKTKTTMKIEVTANKGTNEINKYYYAIGNGEFVESSESSYTFTNLVKNNEYKIKVKVSDELGNYSYVYELNDGINFVTLAKWVVKQYNNEQGNKGIYYHSSSLANGAGDNSYRYAGSSESVNNYVCFGSDAEKCPDNNLYRIIGVFGDQVKLIKADYATTSELGTGNDYYGVYDTTKDYYQGNSSNLSSIGGYYWNNANASNTKIVTNRYDTWGGSYLNRKHLNETYLGKLGTWADRIATTTWPANALETANVLPSVLYINEIVNPTKSSSKLASNEIQKIGLVSVSDYAFAASPSAWTTTPYNYDGNDASGNKIRSINWMYMGLWEWTITNSTTSNMYAYGIGSQGWVEYRGVNSKAYAVRPVFYLNNDILYAGGNGTSSSPIRISVEE